MRARRFGPDRTVSLRIVLLAAIAFAASVVATGCSAPTDDTAESSSDFSAAELAEEEAKIRAEATLLAGEPGDIPQRVVFLHEIYEDSYGNHDFPEVALHGALWAHDFFRVEAFLRRMTTFLRAIVPARKVMDAIARFGDAVKATNRQVFVDTYTNYYFSKRFGSHPGAARIIDASLLAQLRRVHDAAARKTRLPMAERRTIFLTALETEQSESVSRMMDVASDAIEPSLLKPLMLKPVIRFAYFPEARVYAFDDFSDTADRIRCATMAYDIAERVGWDRVRDSMADYSALPDEYFRDRKEFARRLRERLLLR